MTDNNRTKSDSSNSVSSEGDEEDAAVHRRASRSSSNKRLIRKLSTHLDSNGESESDEEISKLQRVIQEQAKELNEEKQASKKLKLLVKLLKRETKQLQKQVEKQSKQHQDPTAVGSQPGGGNSDSDNPPWERRKLDARLAEADAVIREKNTHIEQLLRDCRELEAEKEECKEQIQQLTRQFDECTQQLHLATHNYSTLEETYKDRVTHLESENNRIRIELEECQWQKERNEENLDKISDAVDFTINKCKDIILGKEKTIAELQTKLQHYRSTASANREEEIERLRTELSAATKDLEESAKLLEQFQGLHLSEDKGSSSMVMTDSVKRKLQQLESLKANRKESEKLLAEREEEVAELIRTIKRYESGTYGLSEATKELREARHQLQVRDDHIESLVSQLNALEARLEDLDLENNDLREKFQVESKTFDPSSKRTTLHQQLHQARKEIQKLKDENMQLGLENRSFRRALLKPEEQVLVVERPSPKRAAVSSLPSSNDKLTEEYQKACSEVIVLRKGLVEILQSVREQDGTSDVKIESPVLERLVDVLSSDRLFGHYGKVIQEISSVTGENKILRERILELESSPRLPQSSSDTLLPDTRNKADQAIQAMSSPLRMIDSGNDPVPSMEPSVHQALYADEEVSRLTEQVAGYQEKLHEVEKELDRVKRELEQLAGRHDASVADWSRKESDWKHQMNRKEKRLEELEQEVEVKERTLQELSRPSQHQPEEQLDGRIREDEGLDEAKIRMEKELVTLRVRLDHKEQTLKRSQHFLDEVRLEQLKMIEDHSQEVLGLQNTILEQQRALHRVEQTQREIAASAASSRAVVRHLETEADSNHQLHAQLSELNGQLETARKQAAQWKHAAECLSKEKRAFKESLEKDHMLVVDQLKSQWDASQLDAKELREKVAELQRQLTEERFDKQRSALLQVLVAKLKTELDKKEKQMEFLKRVAEELHARLDSSKPLTTSTPVPTPTTIPLPTPGPINSSPTSSPTSPPNDELTQNLADLELRHAQLEKDFQSQRKQLDSIQSREKSLREQLKEQVALVDKLQNEKGSLSRQMVSLRNRVTRLSGEKVAAQVSVPEDVCRLLKRIKDLETQLAIFHTAEKPADDNNPSAKSQAMDQWKERKKLQTLVDHLKVKSRELQDRIQEDEKQNENLRKTISRLVNEKRALEDKLKLKAHDNERIHRLVEENTHWRLRFENLEREFNEETNTDRHRLQIAVLKERVAKQEKEIAHLQLASPNKTTSTTKSSGTEIVVPADTFNQLQIKLKEHVQRLINLVQMPTKSSGEKRLTIHEGPPMPDIRRTVQTLHQLICKLAFLSDL